MAKISKSTKRRRAKRKPPTLEEKLQRAHRKEIRSVFKNAGFTAVMGVHDKEFTFEERPGDFDDVFVYENILVFAEYTISQSSNISGHLWKKKVLFDLIFGKRSEFIEFFEKYFPPFDETRDKFFKPDECKVIILYCSKNPVVNQYKNLVPEVIFFDYPTVKYFEKLGETIKLSSRFELFSFLRLNYSDVGKQATKTSQTYTSLEGTILPENYSNFDRGYKIVSFYIDPLSLLQKSYVLRKDGWRIGAGLYQRMIKPAKIKSIRKYLNEEERVFVNNIIVTLPNSTKILDSNGDTVDPSKLTTTSPVTLQIPEGFNTIGLIDGQHRIFAYHEGGEFESRISLLREKQNLLATGIIYPKGLSNFDRTKFESMLFLEINSNQTGAASELKQSIGLLLRPFTAESIAKAVLDSLNTRGLLENQFVVRFYEKRKVRTSSIVSFGLRPIVKLSGEDSLYKLWKEPSKLELKNSEDLDLLKKYIDFCVAEINWFLAAVKSKVDASKWSVPTKIDRNKILSTTVINGLINCLRILIENKKTGDFEYYQSKMEGLDDFNFSAYKSSQWKRMGEVLYDKYFK